MRTLLGSPVFTSLTFTKANWIFPSENSSIRSANSPSKVTGEVSSAEEHPRRRAAYLLNPEL
jgi:hypothetical protein